MRKFSFLAACVAALLVAAVALAASNKVVATFIAQASSGASGDVTLTALPSGGTMIHGKLKGLEPNVDYLSQYFSDGTCTAAPGVELARFKANPSGTAVFNTKTTQSIADLKSISVQLSSDLSLKACATVTQ